MATAKKTPLRRLSQRSKRSAAMDWLDRFLKAPKYNPNWDVTRTAAFLRIYEAAAHLKKKKRPDHFGACVLRHRFGLLKKKDALLISVIAFMSPKVLTSLSSDAPADYDHFFLLTSTQIDSLDPSTHDIDTQCAPPLASGQPPQPAQSCPALAPCCN